MNGVAMFLAWIAGVLLILFGVLLSYTGCIAGLEDGPEATLVVWGVALMPIVLGVLLLRYVLKRERVERSRQRVLDEF
jgi:membrane associated rhomboid family serine protease